MHPPRFSSGHLMTRHSEEDFHPTQGDPAGRLSCRHDRVFHVVGASGCLLHCRAGGVRLLRSHRTHMVHVAGPRGFPDSRALSQHCDPPLARRPHGTHALSARGSARRSGHGSSGPLHSRLQPPEHRRHRNSSVCVAQSEPEVCCQGRTRARHSNGVNGSQVLGIGADFSGGDSSRHCMADGDGPRTCPLGGVRRGVPGRNAFAQWEALAVQGRLRTDRREGDWAAAFARYHRWNARGAGPAELYPAHAWRLR